MQPLVLTPIKILIPAMVIIVVVFVGGAFLINHLFRKEKKRKALSQEKHQNEHKIDAI